MYVKKIITRLVSVSIFTIFLSTVYAAEVSSDKKILGQSLSKLRTQFNFQSPKVLLVNSKPKILAKILEASPHVKVVDFGSLKPFDDEFVWSILDLHSHGAIWNDISDWKGSKALVKEVAQLIRPQATQVWVRFEAGIITALTEMVPMQKGLSGGQYSMRMVELELASFQWKSVDVKWNKPWDFSEFQGNIKDCASSCTLSHKATPKLSLNVNSVQMKLALYQENKDPIDVHGDFILKSVQEQNDMIESMVELLKAEKTWMFSQLWPIISDQQNAPIWDWYKIVNHDMKISHSEVKKWALDGGGIKMWNLLDIKVGGRRVKWTSDLHGYNAIEVFK